jgi:1,4-alpha-glucan branching enzyme
LAALATSLPKKSFHNMLQAELDLHLFSRGTHYKLYNLMGGRVAAGGANFCVWAPHAKAVFLIGDFNHWDGRGHPLSPVGSSGVWHIFVPDLKEGDLYKFEIHTADGKRLYKADPYAYCSETRPKTASRLFDIDRFAWTDDAWMKKRGGLDRPINIYELHANSWKKGLNYRQLAHELGAYCHEMGFTHVEFLPLTEHPLDESWGYQVSGFFSITSRFGTPEDFQYLVNHLHNLGIGVIIDWVAAHFPKDDFSLAYFDGTALYEHADPRQGYHPHWNTHIFNYGRYEVSNFLLASALFWLDKMHVDGLRVDAVASMLYLDYGRAAGEWVPNFYGGNYNLEAIEFLRHMNSIVHHYFPTALVFAEESTTFPGVTHALDHNGLGFDLKWNMGWMNDTLRYFAKDPIYRQHHHNDLTFGLVYAFSERFILPLSHDEVVHGKRSLLAKMPGDDWQKFAGLRLLYSYMICQPGKKLLFMGGELGMWNEWDCKGELPWHFLEYQRHQELHSCFKALNHFYLEHPALWEKDFDPGGFEWIDASDTQNSVISYVRKGHEKAVVVVHNFTPSYFQKYFIPFRSPLREVLNTDQTEFGGSGKINSHVEMVEGGCLLQLAPLATMIFEVIA